MILESLAIRPAVSPAFAGWSFVDGDFLDLEGNRYHPEDLKAAYWLRQAWAARAGYPGELRFLRAELAAQLQAAARPLLVEVSRIGTDGAHSLVASLWIPSGSGSGSDPRQGEAMAARVARG